MVHRCKVFLIIYHKPSYALAAGSHEPNSKVSLKYDLYPFFYVLLLSENL